MIAPQHSQCTLQILVLVLERYLGSYFFKTFNKDSDFIVKLYEQTNSLRVLLDPERAVSAGLCPIHSQV